MAPALRLPAPTARAERGRPGRFRIEPGTAILLVLALVATALLAGYPTRHVHELSAGGTARYLAMWLDMTVAMMLPTALPMVHVVHAAAATRGLASRSVAALCVGYCSVWTAAGALAFLVTVGLHRVVSGLAADVARARAMPGPGTGVQTSMPGMSPSTPATHTAGLLVAAGLLVVAGGFQLSPLAHACVRACRSPFGFVARGWHGGAAVRDSYRIGLAYGLSCFGCCAGLMVALLIVGMRSLPKMAAFGLLMAVQKNSRRGEAVRQLAAIGLLVAGLVAAIVAGAT